LVVSLSRAVAFAMIAATVNIAVASVLLVAVDVAMSMVVASVFPVLGAAATGGRTDLLFQTSQLGCQLVYFPQRAIETTYGVCLRFLRTLQLAFQWRQATLDLRTAAPQRRQFCLLAAQRLLYLDQASLSALKLRTDDVGGIAAWAAALVVARRWLAQRHSETIPQLADPGFELTLVTGQTLNLALAALNLRCDVLVFGQRLIVALLGSSQRCTAFSQLALRTFVGAIRSPQVPFCLTDLGLDIPYAAVAAVVALMGGASPMAGQEQGGEKSKYRLHREFS
jgi:hypothetical protein